MSPRHPKPLIRIGCAFGALFTIMMLAGGALAEPAPSTSASAAAPAGSAAAPNTPAPSAATAAPATSASAAAPGVSTLAQKPGGLASATAAGTAAAVTQTPEHGRLAERVTTQRQVAAELVKRVQRLEGRHVLTRAQSQRRTDEIDAANALLSSLVDRSAVVADRRAKAVNLDETSVKKDEQTLGNDLANVEKSLAAQSADVTALEKATGWELVRTILEARCATAICFDNGTTKNWLGIEPLVELPVGKSFAIGRTSLSDWVNNHELHVDLAAGIRIWVFRDIVSFSLYLSKPLSDTPVRLEGSSFVYPGSSIRRPFPGASVGLLFDSIWVGFDRDELRNGDGQANHDATGGSLNSAYPPNEVISSSWTVTVAIQPVTAFRTAIGTAVQASKEGR